MKVLYVRDILKDIEPEQGIELLGWISSKRDLGGVIFLDLVDSTGDIQLVVESVYPAVFAKARDIIPESSVRVRGIVKRREGGKKEIEVNCVEVLGSVDLTISPLPRSGFNPFEQQLTDLVLRKRHLYLRNENLIAVMRFRHLFMGIIHTWFRHQEFIELNAPILTQLPLYDDDSALSLDFFGGRVFLTQCVAFYLESAVNAFEKVYCVGPSFRGEKSTGSRHLAEYWHVKAEVAFADLEDMISLIEDMLPCVARRLASKGAKELRTLKQTIPVGTISKVPYPRITYDEALQRLSAKGFELEWGRSLSEEAESILSLEFDRPFWIVGLPRSIEPFPYVIDPSYTQITKTADLLAPQGFGELLGVAEKIWKSEELLCRMREKGKDRDARYDWYHELRQFGSVPHSGFGMGVERVIRWLLRLNHVRDAIPFPRLFGRSPYP